VGDGVFVRDDEALAGLEGCAHDTLRFGGEGAGAGQVHAGELQAVEYGGSAFDFEVAGGEGVDDQGERHLDGGSILKGPDFNAVSILVGFPHSSTVYIGLMAEVETLVEETKVRADESGRTAAGSCGVDVAAEWDWHCSSPLGVLPPG
jgi:hypothetical protein